MGVGSVVMVVVMIVVVIMPVVVMVVVIMVVIGHHQTAHAGAEGITMHAVSHVRAGCIRPLPFDMVVVAFLHGADL